MSGYQDDEQLNEEELSLDAILAELRDGEEPDPVYVEPEEESWEEPEEDPVPELDVLVAEVTRRVRAYEARQAAETSGGEEKEPGGKAPEKGPGKTAESAGEEKRDWREDTIPFPARPPKESGEAGAKGPSGKGKVTRFPGTAPAGGTAPQSGGAGERPRLISEKKPVSPTADVDDTKVLEFPGQERPNPVAEGIGQLRQRADEFAGHMFEEAGSEAAREVRRAEKLIPGVDVEQTPPPVRERKPRKTLPPPPDLPPAELTRRYAKGIKALRARTTLVFLLLPVQVYLTVVKTLPAALPELPVGEAAAVCYAMAALQALAILLGADIFLRALIRPFQRRMGMDTLMALANLAVLADAVTLALADGAIPRRPFCVVAVLSLWCVMNGSLKKRRGQRLTCRTAASASEPYLVTRDEGKWNGRDTYTKWSGPVTGFGSQIQAEDGAERIFRIFTPVLLVACILFSLISSVGRGRQEDLLWCLAATLSAAASLSATFCFGLPWQRLSHRLARSGAALAGWQGVVNTTGSSNLLLTDIDLFPGGSVTMHGMKIHNNFPPEKVVAVTATVIRDAGSGLEQVFYNELRKQGALYRRGSEFTAYEGGGVSEVIRDELVLVGSASFMVLMDVALPPGLKVKNAVFCAIDGELAGLFVLNYDLPNTVPPAIDSLIRNRITPVLATRDFNLIPSMLRQRFKLPAEKMEFPSVDRRRELSEKEQEHSDTLTAVLCREGVGPYAEAVVGGRRLRSAVRLSAVLACIGSLVGALLCFYLTFVAAYASLTPMNLALYLLMWLVPTPLIAGWVDKY